MTEETPEPVEYKPAEPIIIDQFEGDFIRQFEGKLPGLTMVMPEGYARNTHLKLMVEVRVRNVGYKELKSGELVRDHALVLENIELVGAFRPEDLDPGVGGSAAANADEPLEFDEDHPVLQEDTIRDENLTEEAWEAAGSHVDAHPDDIQMDFVCTAEHPTGAFRCTQDQGHKGMHASGDVVGALW